MKTKLKKINSFTCSLNVVVPWESLKDEFNKEFITQSKKFKMSGFRPGKVPANLVRREIGPAIEANFGESSLNKYYQEALLELNLIPINQAQITELSFKESDDLKFTAIFEIRPEVKLPSYDKKIKFKIDKFIASESDIEQSLKELQNSHSKLKSVDVASIGNYIFADFQELDKDGLPIIGSKIEKQYIKLGEGNFDEKISKTICGKKVEDKVLIDLPFGEGKISKFEMEIKKIEEQVLPDLNDEFAKTVAPDLNSLNELKSRLKDNIIKNLDDDFEKRSNGKIIDYFVDKTKLEVPTSMLDTFLKNIYEDEKKKPNNQNITEEDFNKQTKPYAEKNIKWLFVRDKLIHEEKIEVNDKSVDDFIKDAIEKNESQKDEIKKHYEDPNNKQNLKSDLLTQALFKKLNNYAVIKITEKSTDELRKDQDGKKS